MKNRLFILLLAFANCALIAQESDSLPAAIRLDEVIVVATRTSRALTDLPLQAALIDAKMIQGFPISNIDDILKTTANVYVNRSWGIFSKNAAVTMRGLEGSDRILVMVDGVPKNRIAGGSVNWHNINPDQVERIEVSKGPASALYGNNAMGGVINIITNKPEKESSSASMKLFYGSYQTIGSSLTYSGNSIKKDKGWYWNVNGFYRHGDGY
ncbi:MAG: TonB-dependent receptor plug domain-containing protein, partial [Ignavibacteria bacterium]|nr:TonB-dependent receptor plug domain-containing protein [Ignavibacteria bacterium]